MASSSFSREDDDGEDDEDVVFSDENSPRARVESLPGICSPSLRTRPQKGGSVSSIDGCARRRGYNRTLSVQSQASCHSFIFWYIFSSALFAMLLSQLVDLFLLKLHIVKKKYFFWNFHQKNIIFLPLQTSGRQLTTISEQSQLLSPKKLLALQQRSDNGPASTSTADMSADVSVDSSAAPSTSEEAGSVSAAVSASPGGGGSKSMSSMVSGVSVGTLNTLKT